MKLKSGVFLFYHPFACRHFPWEGKIAIASTNFDERDSGFQVECFPKKKGFKIKDITRFESSLL